MKPNRIEAAVAGFMGGKNCAQAVFGAYSPLLGISEEDALRIAWGFGGGMGRLQLTCGAVTGAIMLIGAARGKDGKLDAAGKERTYALVKELVGAFSKANGTASCAELLGVDLNTDEGHARFAKENMSGLKCAEYVRQSAVLVERLLF